MSEKIRELRIAKNISQVELGRLLGVTNQSVSNWENNNILPSIEMLRKLATFFSVSADFLLGLNETRSLDVSGLSEKQIAHLQEIVNDIKG